MQGFYQPSLSSTEPREKAYVVGGDMFVCNCCSENSDNVKLKVVRGNLFYNCAFSLFEEYCVPF